MKLLLDQNISYRLVKRIEENFPGSQQVKKLQLENKSDLDIWRYARNESYTILTFDSDFYDLSIIYGHPPKIIWIRTGNTTTDNLEKIILGKSKLIKQFINDSEFSTQSCFEVDDQ